MEFYDQDTVQKIIDYQWKYTRTFIKWLFYLYIFFFIIPFYATMFTEEKIHAKLLHICQVPQVILFAIEMVQMRSQGLDYLAGWNLTDFMQFVVFQTLFVLKLMNYGDHEGIMPELQLLLIILSFFKMFFFIRIYKDMGFLVQMLHVCIIDLQPFVAIYISFWLMFSIGFLVLQIEIDPEVSDA